MIQNRKQKLKQKIGINKMMLNSELKILRVYK